MADLFLKQAHVYLEGRPSYPEQLFQFIASSTPSRGLVWDVGTGSGQSAVPLARMYMKVIATDTSQTQLEFAPKLPNIDYRRTPPIMSFAELEQNVSSEGTVDLVTVAQAMHWFDLPSFYEQVKWVLKKPHGVIAAWCYTLPRVCPAFDSVFDRFYSIDLESFWEPQRKMVDDRYVGLEFPFEAVEGLDGTGPLEFSADKVMDLDGFMTYLRSWSAYQTAKGKGIELLTEDVLESFRRAWNEGSNGNGLRRVVKYTIYLRIGKEGCVEN